MSTRALQFVNSFVGRPGNIGVRTGRVLEALSAQGGGGACVCRGAQTHAKGVRYAEMGLLGHAPRLLNAVRIYLAPGFNHRLADIALFEWFALRHLGAMLKGKGAETAHVWDVCPRLITRLRQEGRFVVLDVPIAPLTYAKRLHQEGRASFLLDDLRLREVELEAFGRADMLIAPSRFVSDELIHAGADPGRIAVVEFGVGKPMALSKTAGEHRKTGGLEFCFAGTVNRRKGIPDLIAAWSHPDFTRDRLHLCGRVFPEVSEVLAGAGGGAIITPGFVDTFSYFPQCDVFVFPSWLEGSAKAVYEAMACGLPVIVTRSAGSIVRDGVEGFVIDAGDVGGLRERMLWFKDNPDRLRAMGEAARNRAQEFSWGRYAERVIGLYRPPGRNKEMGVVNHSGDGAEAAAANE